MSTTGLEPNRKRKSHKKSRGGCNNCKLRRVKCDETKPECHKCDAYGVSCSYDGAASDELHMMAGESAFHAFPVPTPHKDPPTPPNDILFGMLNTSLPLHDTEERHVIGETDLELLRKFQQRTILTIGTASTVKIYQKHMFYLISSHGFLAHVVLALVLMHDPYLSSEPFASPSTKESFHIYQGTALFGNKLYGPVKHEEKDALWSAAAILGCITIASIEATCAEESWPYRAPDPTDLDWLRMSEGKKEVWRICDPLRPDSVWSEAIGYELNRHGDVPEVPQRPELDALHPFLIKIYDFDESAHANGDPYHTATSILTRVLGIPCNHSTILYFMSFIGHMDPAYIELLQQKDPRALLLLAWWWAKMCDYPVWWLHRRAKLECRAICLYLERDHSQEGEVIKLLQYAKVMCGLKMP
ncbi:Hypothetical protein R9X50_00398500 [Acrodontium crateriforme]|uniref:Zn(2)-C6 fungal-type domain-containing protein n=1 Tax=Acrodontium crateriforme TaxID=150365 RepID=A0AAQ3M4I2_9PEZI|nr:Hypothetical protein R9X50_00398500 [Acrodontium crateriforme]